MNEDMLLRRSDAEIQSLKKRFRVACSFWNSTEADIQVFIEERQFAEQVYLAMDWPTFVDARCL